MLRKLWRKYPQEAWGEFLMRSFYGLFFFAAGVSHLFSFETTKEGATILGLPTLAPYLAWAAIFCLMVGG